MRAILIDDEPANSVILSKIISTYCPSVSLCGQAGNIDEAQQLIADLQPELLFLDIEMPGGSGFDLLDRIGSKKIQVIFVTGHDSFLLKAIRYSALDYIMKPVSIPEVVAAVGRARERLADSSINHQLQLLMDNLRQPQQIQRIAIPHKEEYIFVPVADIVRLEAKAAYTEIITKDKKTYLVSKNIKEYEEMLPAQVFCRVHHAHLVNLDFVRNYHKGRGGYIEMLSGESIEVSVRKKDEFLSRFR